MPATLFNPVELESEVVMLENDTSMAQDLPIGKDGRLAPLKFTLIQSDQAYTQTSRAMPCQLYFMLVAELTVAVIGRGPCRSEPTQSFTFSTLWPEPVENATMAHPELAALFQKFKDYNPNLLHVNLYEIRQMVKVHLCASFSKGAGLTTPFLKVCLSYL
jgi:hypothetical protein